MNAAPTDFFRRGVPLLRVVILLMLGLLWAPAAAAAPPADFQTSLVVGDGLNGPSGFEIAPDGRIFILERSGKIKIVKNGQLLPTPFADLPSEDTGDRGLIGIAFDPEFGVSNHYVYFYYTGHDLLNHLVRFNAAEDVGTDGPFELFRTSSPSHLLHVGGSIRFGPDGKLYFAVADPRRHVYIGVQRLRQPDLRLSTCRRECIRHRWPRVPRRHVPARVPRRSLLRGLRQGFHQERGPGFRRQHQRCARLRRPGRERR